MKNLLLLVPLFSFFFSQAQNLVPNPSFENSISCPDNLSQVYKIISWKSYGQSPDYFDSCGVSGLSKAPNNSFGFQYPASGQAYCGLYTFLGANHNYREFIGTQLVNPLVFGTKYYITIRLNLADQSNCATNNLSVFFSTTDISDSLSPPVLQYAQIHCIPIITDNTTWEMLSSSFIADSNYNFVIIGNPFLDQQTDTLIFSGSLCNAYYYIDDVCVSTDSLTCQNALDGIRLDLKSGSLFFPNPATDRLFMKRYLNPPIIISIINIQGVSIKSFTNQHDLEIGDIPSGLYLIRFKENENLYYQTITIIN